MATIVIPASDLKPGDVYDGETVEEVRQTDKGNVSFKTDWGWRRRPGEELLAVKRT
jgi:hypothetical protein